MRTLPRTLAPALLLLVACAGDPWVEWPLTEVSMSDLEITRTAWDQGQVAEPGPDGQPRYSWELDIQNTSTTIWSGRVQIIAELDAGGTVIADTVSDQMVIPGRRVVTAANFGRMPGGVAAGSMMPRFRVRIGAWCATVQGETGEAAPCPEEPAVAEPGADVGPPIG